ncbi:MAG: preprotein translocase subunit SecE [Patescibacteria group bacterium]
MQAPAKPALPKIASPVQFVREVITELKKVTWPTREETIKLTLVVIVLSFLVGAFIGILDITFLKITSLLFKR